MVSETEVKTEVLLIQREMSRLLKEIDGLNREIGEAQSQLNAKLKKYRELLALVDEADGR